MAETNETSLKWCYVNDKKDVMMVMDEKTFEQIKNALNDYLSLKRYVNRFESDMWNYSYTRRG